MKILIAIPSCHALRNCEQTIRETWGKDLPTSVDLRFFLGQPVGNPQADEIFLDCGDSLAALTIKCVAMFRWALAQGYDYVWKVDLDTFVRPQQLPTGQYDWIGGQNSHFASGGAGYGLSRRALEFVVSWPINQTCAEDLHTAEALLSAGITLHADPRFKFIPGQHLESKDVTYHLSSVVAWDAKYKPEWMYAAYSSTGGYHPTGLIVPEKRPVRFRR
jgi:Galactosyltransferase